MKFTKSIPLKGELKVPGDKSISHRGVMLGSLAQGTTAVTNFLEGADCLSTINCFRSMGIDISRTEKEILIHGKGLHGLSAPSSCLDVGNSGTTMRLLSGILAGQRFSSELTGDASYQKTAHDTGYRSAFPYGRVCGKSFRKRTCTPSHYRKTFKGYALPISRQFCTGKILCTFGRTLCRRTNQCYRTLSFQKSF